MYAVEKLGSYISRGVYTVSGPFHPFGGAVDIIVVQQQDGSFKSSPWYVRFGKFQGVLKTKEKLVKISVNGVEAGFSMYLDHKGEAFFLKDTEGEEQEFILSPPTSGDEAEGKTKNCRPKKSLSFNAEGGQRERVAQVDEGKGKLVNRTKSGRSTLFGLVFGRKSFKGNNKDGNVERTNSLERAEIAADLLDVKWSTNLKSGDKRINSLVKTTENSGMNVGVAEEEQDPRTPVANNASHYEQLNHHDVRMDDDLDKANLTSNCLEEAKDNDPSSPKVGKEPAEIRTAMSGDKAISDQKNTAVDHQICCINFDAAVGDSAVSHVEGAGGTHSNNMLVRNTQEEMASNGKVVLIYASQKTETADGKPVTEPLDETDARGSAAFHACNLQSHAKFLMGSKAGISTFDNGDREVTPFSCRETTEINTTGLNISDDKATDREVTPFSCRETTEINTTGLNISDDKATDHLSLLSGVSGNCGSQIQCEPSNMVPDVTSLSEFVTFSGKRTLDDLHNQRLETASETESCVSEKSQYDSPVYDTLKGLDNNGFATEPDPTSCPEQLSRGIPFFFSQQSLSCEDEVTSPDVLRLVTSESADVKETYLQQTDLVGSQSQIEDTQAVHISSFHASVTSNPLDFGTTKSHSFPKVLCHRHFNDSGQILESLGLGDNLNRSHSFDEIAQSFDIISRPTEVEEYSVPCSESSEDVQFPFSDIDNFSDKYNEPANNEKVGEAEDGKTLVVDYDLEEQDLQAKNNRNSLEEESDFLRSHCNPINIPSYNTSVEESELSSKSLPTVRNNIKELEGLPLHHSLSCSLVEKTDMLKLDNAIISSENEEPKATLTNAPVELSLCKHLLFEGMGENAAQQVFDAEKVDLEKFMALGPSLVKNEKLVVRIGDQYFPWDTAAPIVLGIICFGQKKIFELQGMIPVNGARKKYGASTDVPSRGSWNLWPFMKRSKTLSYGHSTSDGTKGMDVDPASKSTGKKAQESQMLKADSPRKVPSLTPTSEELASLNLKEGQNVVTFSFSTAMLGLQQVDARIYLWKWNTRIVISDVDGTITKSDVLGQFMPLVGFDWSQTGVTHLFSAIKENGYQLLFLSARAISQAHLTRQFLFNLKQDGKALPDGPVVISPDGLFPSLYREVIRRAPHEFKISCLEVIKALFPPDCIPFYAGFGNRDTDEISYLKVGIPMGKIFIINPKGQVAVNRRVDTKSYSSLHDLVNGIFPSMSSFEQEDYNSWNYWKLPLPEISSP